MHLCEQTQTTLRFCWKQFSKFWLIFRACNLGFSGHSLRTGCYCGDFKWESYQVDLLQRGRSTSTWMITDNSVLLSKEVFMFCGLQCNFRTLKLRNFWDIASQNTYCRYEIAQVYETLSFFKFNSGLFNCNARSHRRRTHAPKRSYTRVRSC